MAAAAPHKHRVGWHTHLAVGISLLELIYTLVTGFMYLTMLTLLILRYSDIPAFPWYLTVLTL